MKILSKIFKYFIGNPFKKLIFLLAVKSKRENFKFFFNFYSLINFSKERIYIKNNFYFFKNRNWKFFHKKHGLDAYARGFETRKEELKFLYLIDKLEFQDNDIIIDIGANNGDFYLCFNKKIKYYGIEPSPIVFLNLKHNIKNQTLINMGVWKTSDKEIEFFLCDESGDSSIIPIKNFTEKIKIKTTTLDEIIDKIDKPIKLIKLEAEGAEPEILEGLKKNLSRVSYITIDCGFERGIEQNSTIAECSNYLIKNNFEMTNFINSRVVTLFKNKSIL